MRKTKQIIMYTIERDAPTEKFKSYFPEKIIQNYRIRKETGFDIHISI